MDNVKNCTLVGLTDLDQSLPHTQERIVDYLNRLVDMGVSGFRFDASKHMWPDVRDASWRWGRESREGLREAETRKTEAGRIEAGGNKKGKDLHDQ